LEFWFIFKWEAINRKQITRWQHVSQLKASSFYLLVKKIIIVKNATAYTRDWYGHLGVDRASLVIMARIFIKNEKNICVNFSIEITVYTNMHSMAFHALDHLTWL
jgi:hypothetical protein